ncbi:hypothetical protein WMF27_18255 [Sorangium sp. So ce281]|uniref:hypothetical protein n=1 Tax=unclassified Sorangium TaxID=2621164 RepID=UPI003F61923D
MGSTEHWPWYDIVSGESADQGDIIVDYPALRLPSDSSAELETYTTSALVMNQTCDLANGKDISSLVLCPIKSVAEFVVKHPQFRREADKTATKLNVSVPDIGAKDFEERAWKIIWQNKDIKKQIDGITKGQRPAYVTLCEHRDAPVFPMSLVGFHHVFVQPRSAVDRWLASRGPRLRLRPPYRDHVSQAFGMFFMRVGLHQAVPRLAD